jgi:GNAT superfamily N-acetyltransferase
VYVDIKESNDNAKPEAIDVPIDKETGDFYIKDPADGTSMKVTFGYEKTKISGFDEDAILVTAFYGDRKLPIGNLHLDSKTRMVKDISVLEDYQRQGVATELWKYAQEQGLKPKHSPLKTPEGEKWAESLKE